MSLLSRVSSIEQFPTSAYQPGAFSHNGPSRGASPTPSFRARNLSFNPIPQKDDWEIVSRVRRPSLGRTGSGKVNSGGLDEHLNRTGAFEVKRSTRVLQVVSAVIYCLLAAGVVFGYAALKPVLIQEKVYRNLCTTEELEKDIRVCFAQEIRLNLMFTAAAVVTNVAALPIGALLDHSGPRLCGLLGSGFLAIGAVLFALASAAPVDLYIPGYLFLALGGPFIFISSFQLSNTFPAHSGLILALLTGAFDTSSAILLFYRILYSSTGGETKPRTFFLAYLAVPSFILLVQLFLMPNVSYETVGEMLAEVDAADALLTPEDQMDEQTVLLREERRARRESIIDEVSGLLGSARGTKQKQRESKKQAVSGIWGVMHGRDVVEQIRSPWFVLITLFTVIQMTRINYFVATIRPQYERLLGTYERAVEINNFFDVMLPLGGIISIPFIGTVLDRTSTLTVLCSLVAIATTIGVLGILPYTWAAYGNVVLFTLYRPFYYTAVSDYAAKVFGFRTFGTVYGLTICLAGLGNFSQSLLDTLTLKVFQGDPIPVNIGLMSAALVVGVALAGYVGWKAHLFNSKEGLVEEAEHTRETPMPNAVERGRL